jgi:hypothetical protein
MMVLAIVAMFVVSIVAGLFVAGFIDVGKGPDDGTAN